MFNPQPRGRRRQEQEIFDELEGPANPRTVNQIVEKLNRYAHIHRRGFLNLVRRRLDDEEDEMFGLPYRRRDDEENSFLEKPSLEREISRFNAFASAKSEFEVGGLNLHIDDIVEACVSKKEYAEKIGTVDINRRTNWHKWNKYIIDVCEEMNKKYPRHFCQALKATINYVQAELLKPAGFLYMYNLSAQTETTEYSENDWMLLQEKLDGYKFNASCGYIFGVLEHWLVEATTRMRQGVREFGPFVSPAWVEAHKMPKFEATKSLEQVLEELQLDSGVVDSKGALEGTSKDTTSDIGLPNLPNDSN